ncbi:hypothetical protein [Virgibacillus pantothenticus]|uniref:hypothetical protein n=1 Tax=Virgibacillus pantothenticus TaxID=1473 RepID=UPI0009847768|nr:hypothetical protein [Virgibacillus pantothenticus]
MGETAIYLLFTDTGTNLAKAIHFFTKQSLNHVSIGFDEDLKELYSFGRKRPKNPFIGGFVREDIRSDFLKKSDCAVYRFNVSDEEREQILHHINQIEREKDRYRYNFIGLIGILLQIEINRKCAFFCSQFVATVLKNAGAFQIKKPTCFVTPEDIRSHEGMQLIYEGRLGDYPNRNKVACYKQKEEEQVMSSYIIYSRVNEQ